MHGTEQPTPAAVRPARCPPSGFHRPQREKQWEVPASHAPAPCSPSTVSRRSQRNMPAVGADQSARPDRCCGSLEGGVQKAGPVGAAGASNVRIHTQVGAAIHMAKLRAGPQPALRVNTRQVPRSRARPTPTKPSPAPRRRRCTLRAARTLAGWCAGVRPAHPPPRHAASQRSPLG